MYFLIFYLAFSLLFYIGTEVESPLTKKSPVMVEVLAFCLFPFIIPVQLGRAIQIYLNKNSN